jgi:hypothetical protein
MGWVSICSFGGGDEQARVGESLASYCRSCREVGVNVGRAEVALATSCELSQCNRKSS